MRKLMRVLSVFVAVVIVAVGFMQPVVYANGLILAAGGAMVLIVAGLLVAAGMTFSTPAQAQSTAEYAISVMPDGLESEILARVQISGDSYVLKKSKVYQMIEKGLLNMLPLPRETWEKFKAWVNETFGINAETAAAGSVDYSGEITGESIPANTRVRVKRVENGKEKWIYSPVLPAEAIQALGTPYVMIVDNSDDGIYGATSKCVLIICSYAPFARVNNYGWVVSSMAESGDRGYYRFRWFPDSSNASAEGVDTDLWVFSGKHSFGSSYARCNSVDNIFYSNHDFYDKDIGSLLRSVSKNCLYILDTANISSDAYAHTMPSGVNEVQITLPSDFTYFHDYTTGKVSYSWTDFLSNYDGVSRAEAPTADWDYRKSLDDMQKTLDGISANLGVFGAGTYDGLLNQTDALKREVDRLNGVVAAQGADVIGGTQALNDAMVEAGYVIQGLQSLLNETATADAARTAELEAEIERAKQTIKDLTDGKTGDVSVPDVKEGAIDWSILQGIDVFDLFPFCLPWDVYDVVSVLIAPPKEPVFEVDIFNGKFNGAGLIRLDFSSFEEFEKIRLQIRYFYLVLLIIGTLGATKKYIWTGGG